jgi:hypothetical protein
VPSASLSKHIFTPTKPRGSKRGKRPKERKKRKEKKRITQGKKRTIQKLEKLFKKTPKGSGKPRISIVPLRSSHHMPQPSLSDPPI